MKGIQNVLIKFTNMFWIIFPMRSVWRKAASAANLSTAAFCRYFRKRTNKTFIQFLNEVRIGQACRLLINENNSVSDICYTCGYNNNSYFIRQFRKITGFTPLNYRRKFAD
jgi:AraC-like DNA-binding protein